jgi:hypothetical protein
MGNHSTSTKKEFEFEYEQANLIQSNLDFNNNTINFSDITNYIDNGVNENRTIERVETRESTNELSSQEQTEKSDKKEIVIKFKTKTINKQEPKKRGRKCEKSEKDRTNNSLKLPRKFDRDDITIKNQVHYSNFIPEFVNFELENYGINGKFKKIDYQLKKKCNFNYFNELNGKKLYEILIMKASSRYKNIGENYNAKLYERIKDIPVIKNILNENYLTFFRSVYYPSGRKINLKKYTDDNSDLIITLPMKIEKFMDKVNTFKDQDYAEAYKKCVEELYLQKVAKFNPKK